VNPTHSHPEQRIRIAKRWPASTTERGPAGVLTKRRIAEYALLADGGFAVAGMRATASSVLACRIEQHSDDGGSLARTVPDRRTGACRLSDGDGLFGFGIAVASWPTPGP